MELGVSLPNDPVRLSKETDNDIGALLLNTDVGSSLAVVPPGGRRNGAVTTAVRPTLPTHTDPFPCPPVDYRLCGTIRPRKLQGEVKALVVAATLPPFLTADRFSATEFFLTGA